MIELTASEVAQATGGRLTADPGVRVTGPVVADSRLVEPGALFAAIPGARVDGADFAAGAVADGAVLVLAAREIDGLPVVVVDDVAAALGDLARVVLERLRAANPAVKVFSITGSAGKTTTKDLLGRLVAGEAADGGSDTIAPTGSFNSEIGLPLTVLRGTAATRKLVLELGADKPGDIGYLASIVRPQIAVILMVGTAHIEFFGSQEAIADAKAEVLGGLVPGGTAVLNADDERVLGLAPRATALGHRVVTFGRVPSADVRAEDVTVDATGRASFTLRVRGRVAAAGEVADDLRLPVSLRLVGEHHVSNALAAATAAILAGTAPSVVAERLSAAEPGSPHRMAVTERPDGITVVDDAYNANPESMRAALRSVAVMAGRTRRSVAVLGEMRELGEGARAAHDAIGRLVVRLNIKLLVVVGDGAYHIHEGAMQEGSWGEETVFVPDLDAARAELAERLRPGDVVLVKASNGSGLWQLGDELAAGTLGAAL
ncbi:UDP-N-acetylmuramoylalanyl-D-glutamyl-2,6-diamin opimelate/D-alanyl-D-alanylligase [Xylanimonas cellulosilytica DSM 15894]|uniref:UDP-N-acetylmuramoyl-tripeptide--D-alanyl-D-alanine ligase n=1 Tax=Xylanimonas cellulosilytica (strain DSM 15894 / JCM 12276 / CECT 5975 / KCTC 9989 / LMG 20990 / NBRC 107835 / XIL07) TaxID=446471 RepID=D1C0C2_XYLCX|nr:UDP-N-acetylmuramoyl-tripeptide--D-alanyl-D-alanine ligase [Xylanimonas cellulosilytica]ACZ30311.1 UDP-N-acetylmuramoylalanyl-D-glutamyl-2,6-diamin opimelate/D-alanyl-D-alanylligase [Xylanimonas cellulosilytica DSM 15894]